MTVLSTNNNSKRPEIQKYWNSGPPIQASFYTQLSSIFQIILSPAYSFSCHIFGSHHHEEILEWMENYSKRKEGKELPLDFAKLSLFTIKGILAIKKIPLGGCSSYREIAALAGKEKGARAIGNVCNKNPYPLVIPCHRVIQSNGSLGGFAYPIEMKQLLLDFES
ncbi:MAG: MGMT family protein [Candidatus Neptunochlamydia sp.]|nr:MGMT family protein [Candidatus Neptunochlamydia sp.]